MTTQWIPFEEQDKYIWITTDETIISRPHLQVTTAGRKIRIGYKPETSFWAKDYPDEIASIMRKEAKKQGSELLCRVVPGSVTLNGRGGMTEAQRFDIANRIPIEQVFKIKDKSSSSYFYRQEARLLKKFVHPTLPIVVILEVSVMSTYDGAHYVVSFVQHSNIADFFLGSPKIEIEGWKESAETLTMAYAAERILQCSPFSRAQDLEVSLHLVESEFEDSVTGPHGQQPKVHKLKLVNLEQNYDESIFDSMAEMSTKRPSVERIELLAKEIRDELRIAGLVFEEPNTSKLSTLLAVGERDVSLVMPIEIGSNTRAIHSIGYDIVHGKFVIACSQQHGMTALHDWEKAKMLAALTGDSTQLEQFLQASMTEVAVGELKDSLLGK
jgi:hypothetical protein